MSATRNAAAEGLKTTALASKSTTSSSKREKTRSEALTNTVAAQDAWAAATLLVNTQPSTFARVSDETIDALVRVVIFRPSAAAFVITEMPSYISARLTEKQRAMLVEAAALSAARW